jgi:acetoacetate decarboxylase
MNDVFMSVDSCGLEYAVYTSLMTPWMASLKPSSGYWGRLVGMLAPGEWLYNDAHYLVAEMEVDVEAARRWVPRPLRLASPARASLFLAWFPHTSFGSVYREAGLFLHVEPGRKGAVFSPWMIVDDDVALILGRELLGYPKKMGTIDFSIEGDSVSGVASRRGVELVRMEGTLGERLSEPPPMLGRPHKNVRSSLGLAMPKLVAFTPREQALEVRRAELRVTVGGSERDPLASLGFGRVLSSRLHRVNLGASFPPLPVSMVSPAWHLRQWLLRAH